MIFAESFATSALDPDLKTGLIFCGMGGPDGPEAVEPFLRNLFRDPEIFPLPGLLRPLLARLIARRRSPAVRERYAMISRKSVTPQLSATRGQARELAARLTKAGYPTVAAAAMRYWNPYPAESVADLLAEGAKQFVVVPAYPQFAGATTGSTLLFVQEALNRAAPGAPISFITDWHDLAGYAATVAAAVLKGFSPWAAESADPATCAVLYAAHSLPESFIAKGDPYLDQTRSTVRSVHALVQQMMKNRNDASWFDRTMGADTPLLAFQSRVGPIKWVGPELIAETERLAAAGCRRLFVQPVSFTCEHIETLHELDIELKHVAQQAGIQEFRRGTALNFDTAWLDGLAESLVRKVFAAKEGSYA